MKPRDIEANGLKLTRRKILIGGGTVLVGTTLVGRLSETALAQAIDSQVAAAGTRAVPRGVTTKDGGLKPVYLPESGSTDPVAHSLAENLFWTDILAEHGRFFAMLMPGPELAKERDQAEHFQRRFATQFEKVRTAAIDRANLAAFNRTTVEMVKPFVDFKNDMFKAQRSGRLKSLVWPTFFDHTAREAERFSRRLEQLSRGTIEIEKSDAVGFWTQIMGEHADFIVHLLDPEEFELIEKAMKTSQGFRQLHDQRASREEAVERAVDEVIDFKTAALKGVQTGQIKSIIHPTLADHVRREAVKCSDELRRSD
jgi:Domain of unknown function (DUF2935)